MRQPLKFLVAGLPAGQPRVKARFTGKFTQIYTPTTVKGSMSTQAHPAATWKMIVRAEAEKAWHAQDYPNQWIGPLRVNLTFYFQRPKGHFRRNGELKPSSPKWHTSKPDRDNAEKLILDTLTNLCIWGDDCQVCGGTVRKFYTDAIDQQFSGCFIEISEAETPSMSAQNTN